MYSRAARILKNATAARARSSHKFLRAPPKRRLPWKGFKLPVEKEKEEGEKEEEKRERKEERNFEKNLLVFETREVERETNSVERGVVGGFRRFAKS